MQSNVLIITHWSFKDALIQNYTLPYIHKIRSILSKEYKIIIITSEQKNIKISEIELNKINKKYKENNIEIQSQKYYRMGLWKLIFTLINLLRLFITIKINNIKIIHCFCTPAGSLGYILSLMTGAALIIDSFEPHAESMVENGTWSSSGLPYKLLFLFEKLQSKRAKFLIGTTSSMKDYAEKKYTIKVQNFFTKPACVNLDNFKIKEKDDYLLEELNLKNKIVCVYAGKIGGIYLKTELFDFIKECYFHWGNGFRFLFLTNASREDIIEEISRINIPEEIIIQKFVDTNDVPRYLSLGDFALNTVKPLPTKKYCTSIKDGEYWAVGLPLIITKDISDDSQIIDETNYGYVLKELNIFEYKKAINKIDILLTEDSKVLKSKIRSLALKYRNIEQFEYIYKEIYK